MTTIKQLEKEKAELEEKLRKLNERIEFAKKPWKPSQSLLSIDVDVMTIRVGPYFNRMMFYSNMLHLAKELNEGWEPDWRDCRQSKITVARHECGILYSATVDYNPGIPVFKDTKTAVRAIEILEASDWAKYGFGEF